MERWLGLASAAGAVFTVLTGGFYIPPGGPDALPVFADASPTRAEVAARIGVGPLEPRSERADKFATLLTQRYRSQFYAVRVLIHPEGHIELRCGANMTRHQMAEVASQVQEDARAIFGSYMPLVLYETYAAGPRRRIGEMTFRRKAQKPVLTFTAPPQRQPDY